MLGTKHFQVIAWPPEKVTKGVIQILASSTECESAPIRKQIALELSGQYFPEQRMKFVARKVLFSGSFGAVEVFKAMIIGHFGSKTVLTAVYSPPIYSQKKGALFPLQSTVPEIENVSLKWNTSIYDCYQAKWDGVIQNLTSGPICMNECSSVKPIIFGHHVATILDELVTALVSQIQGIRLQTSLSKALFEDFLLRLAPEVQQIADKPRPEDVFKEEIDSTLLNGQLLVQMQEVAIQFLAPLFSKTKLQENKSISLLKKHLLSQSEEDKEISFYTEFERVLDINELGKHDRPLREDKSIDCLRIMKKVLKGQLRKTTSIQLSILQKGLGC